MSESAEMAMLMRAQPGWAERRRLWLIECRRRVELDCEEQQLRQRLANAQLLHNSETLRHAEKALAECLDMIYWTDVRCFQLSSAIERQRRALVGQRTL